MIVENEASTFGYKPSELDKKLAKEEVSCLIFNDFNPTSNHFMFQIIKTMENIKALVRSHKKRTFVEFF